MSAERSSSTVSKRRTHSRFSFRVRTNRSAQPLPSGSRTKAGELSMPRKRISARKWWLTYWLPWSWRSRRPAATSLANAPKRSRTACLTGSGSSKRSASREAWMPTHSAEQWSTATNTAAWPSPVSTEVRSVPHIRSTRSVVIVPSCALGPPGALRCQQAVRPHEPQDAAAAGADAGEAQPGPELAVTLAVEGAVPQELPDRLDQGLVRHRADRPGPPTLALIRAAVAVDGRPRDAPQARDPLQTVDSVGGGRDLPAHRLGLRRAKGRCVSKRSIFASRSSAAIVSSPTLACSRPISASRASAGRLFSEASPPARNWSRQPLSSAAVTPSSRETSSRSSPRSRRSTASCLRRADIRRRGSGVGPSPPAWRARSAGPTLTPTFSSILHLLAAAYLQSGVSAERRPGEPRPPEPQTATRSLTSQTASQPFTVAGAEFPPR